MKNYQRTSIYKVIDVGTGELVHLGHSTQKYLSQRLASFRARNEDKLQGRHLAIVKVKDFPCENIDQVNQEMLTIRHTM